MKITRVAVALTVLTTAAVGIALFRARPIEVVVAKVVRGRAIDAAYATGTIEALDRLEVKASISGSVSQIFVKVGQRVQRGEVLARVANPAAKYELRRGRVDQSAATAHASGNAPQLARLSAQATGMYAEQDAARNELARVQQLASQAAATDSGLEQARARLARADAAVTSNEAEQRALRIDLNANALRQTVNTRALAARFDDTNIRAPIGGIVLRKLVELGEFVVPTQALFRIGDDSGLILETLIDEADVARISDGSDGRPASTAGAALYAFPHEVFWGTVFELLPDADRERKAFLAKIRLTAPPVGLRSGMSAEVNIVRNQRDHALLMPVEALNDDKVWVVQDEHAELRTVQLGLRDMLRVEVLAGLNENDALVVSSPAELRQGSRVLSTLRPLDHVDNAPGPARYAREQR